MTVPAPGRRPHVVTSFATLAAGVLIVAMLISGSVIDFTAHQSPPFDLGLIALYAALSLVGLVVTWHQPRNLMGWVLLGVGFFFLLDFFAASYVLTDYHHHHGTLPLGWLAILLAAVSGSMGVILTGVSLLLFPEGRVPSPRWSPMLWAYLILGASLMGSVIAISVGAVIGHHIRIDSSGVLTAVSQPNGSAAWWGVLQDVFFPTIAVCWLAWLAGQVLGYRHAVGERRLQLKWLLSGATVFIVATIAEVAINTPAGLWRAAYIVATVGTFALPVSIGFGIMKFRLYDIDRIISRTLAYALVSGTLVGVYAGLVLLATQVLGVHAPVAVAASTLVAAALFSPLRRLVQRAVDRRFNRARYDAEQTVAAYAARLQDAVELSAVSADLLAIVDGALQPTHVSLWTGPGR
jgi:MFS family permease